MPDVETLSVDGAAGDGAVAQFLESRLAVAALCVLALVASAALLAPWLAPQNPYDLSVIDVREGRMPPGTAKLTKPASVAVVVAVSALADAAATVQVTAARTSDAALTGEVRVRFEAVPSATAAQGVSTWRLEVSARPGSALDPLDTLSIDGLPRDAVLTAGEKLRFRNRWTLAARDLDDLQVTFKRPGSDRMRLRLELTGGLQTTLMTYWLGTDDQGRDVLSAILYGLRISLLVAITSVVIAVAIGTLAGLYAAYAGGRFDTLLMRFVDLQLSFPTILVALILLAVLGKGIGNVMLALVIVQWAFYARTVRGIALAERRKEYVEAAESLALNRLRIIVVHILPNCLPSLIVVATLQIGSAITLEATLSFLGLGLPVTQPSLGLLISNGFEYLLSGYPWISVMPGVALLITVVSINLVGDELRDVLNPRLKV